MTTPQIWASDINVIVEEVLANAIRQAFSDGFLAGATAYAAGVGHSTLMRDNKELVKLRDFMPERLKTLFVQECAQAGPAKESETTVDTTAQ